MNQSVKKWVCVGAGFGAGAFAVIVVIVVGVMWYSSRPKPWDQNALQPSSEVLWSYTLDQKAKDVYANVSFLYTVRNATNHDIRVSTPVTIMLNPSTGDLIELPGNLYQVSFPSFIPAGKSVQVTLDAPPWYTAGTGKGFILYDQANHFQINLPEPKGPTSEDQKKMIKQP